MCASDKNLFQGAELFEQKEQGGACFSEFGQFIFQKITTYLEVNKTKVSLMAILFTNIVCEQVLLCTFALCYQLTRYFLNSFVVQCE